MKLWLLIKRAVLEAMTEMSRKRHMRYQRHLQEVRLVLGEVDPAAAIEAELGQLLESLDMDEPFREEMEDELPPPGGYLH
jgi:Glu-tRNA(Gln) amidotransferase subunit E-like FAD-binding protein